MNYSEVKNKIEAAVNQLKMGNLIVVTDDQNRENEADLVGAASCVTYDSLNFIIKEARGLMCAPISSEIASRLSLSQMVSHNSDLHQTAFTVSVDADKVTTTGISVSDRLATLRALASSLSKPTDFKRPGHIFPLTAKDGGLFARRGHTEATIELLKIASLPLAGVLCEIIDDDGKMRVGDSLSSFCDRNKLVSLSVEEIVYYLKMQPDFVSEVVQTTLPTKYGTFNMVGFSNKADSESHFALYMGDVANADAPIVRIHSECLTGDTLGSLRCDCGDQLHQAMETIAKNGVGLIVYLRQEGRGIGLFNKLKAYQLQDKGTNTIDANLALGFDADLRDYSVGAAILRNLGVKAARVLTNNPDKIEALKMYGIEVVERVECYGSTSCHNKAYLDTKRELMGHYLK